MKKAGDVGCSLNWSPFLTEMVSLAAHAKSAYEAAFQVSEVLR